MYMPPTALPPRPPPLPPDAPAPAPAAVDGTALKAPMPGLIIRYVKNVGDAVKKGDSLVTLYTSKEESLKEAERMYREAVIIGDNQPAKEPLVYARVEKDKVEKY